MAVSEREFHMRAMALIGKSGNGDRAIVVRVPRAGGDIEFETTENFSWSTIGNLYGVVMQLPAVDPPEPCECKACRDSRLLHDVLKLAFDSMRR